MAKYIKEASWLLVVRSLVLLSTVCVHCLDSVYGVDRLYLIVASPVPIPTLQLEKTHETVPERREPLQSRQHPEQRRPRRRQHPEGHHHARHRPVWLPCRQEGLRRLDLSASLRSRIPSTPCSLGCTPLACKGLFLSQNPLLPSLWISHLQPATLYLLPISPYAILTPLCKTQ